MSKLQIGFAEDLTKLKDVNARAYIYIRSCYQYTQVEKLTINTLEIMTDRLSYEEKKELPDSVFGLPERREYPMPDAAHVRAAEAYFRYCPEDLKPRLARAILERARDYGVDVESPVILSYADK